MMVSLESNATCHMEIGLYSKLNEQTKDCE